MVRRLIDQDPRREVRRQGILLDRLDRVYARRFRAEITRAMMQMADGYAYTGEVMPARGHQEALEAIFRDLAIQSATVFGGRVIQQGKNAGLVLETKGFAETMARLALRYVASEAIRRRIVSIAETTRNQVMRAVAQGYADGLGQVGVAKYIRNLIPSFSSARANLIARTETHGAANFGANEAAKETGLDLQREWIAAEDDRTRESHVAANGQIVGRDQPFSVGDASMMYPGDPDGPPEESINCRCATGFIVDTSTI
jgi:SPP1 gp7 family putative phage head morphogenesis protein